MGYISFGFAIAGFVFMWFRKYGAAVFCLSMGGVFGFGMFLVKS